MHPAIVLLWIIQILLIVLIPLLLGMLTYATGRRARLWFLAGIGYSVYIISLFLFQSNTFSFIRLFQIASLWVYIGTIIYFLLIEAGLKPVRLTPIYIAAVPTVPMAYLSYVHALQLEQIVQAAFVVVCDGAVGVIALGLLLKGYGRGFAFVSASGFLVAVASLLKIDELLFGSGSFQPTDFTWKTNFLVAGHLIGVVFVNIGYAGVVIEQSTRREAASLEGRKVAEEANKAIARALEERDQMVMLNSQFAAMSGMTLFASSIVHEITQPLQSLILSVHNAMEEASVLPRLQKAMEGINKQAADCNAIVQSLRALMRRGRSDIEMVDIVLITEEILPVIKSQCKRHHIELNTDIKSRQLTVAANPTLYRRIVFNLVTNAIEALDASKVATKSLRVALLHAGDKAVLTITDNAGQMINISELTFETLANSFKPTGVGLGLMLCDRIAKSWNGRLSVSTHTSSDDAATVFSLELPLANV